MALDPDILAADNFVLEKIKAQAYRYELADLKAHRAALLAADIQHKADCLAAQTASLAWQKEQFYALPPELTYRQRIALAIAEKYMTTSTAVDPLAVADDAKKDAARLKAAVDAALVI